MKAVWAEITNLANNRLTLLTKNGAPFQVVAASKVTIVIRVATGKEHTISRKNLEKAIRLIQEGASFSGPKEYRALVADDRPTYAWAILKHLGYLD